MFYEVDASNKRDVVGVEAEDGEALDDGLQLLHALPVDGALLSGISADVEELSKGRQKFFRQAVERWSRLLRKMSGSHWEGREFEKLLTSFPPVSLLVTKSSQVGIT